MATNLGFDDGMSDRFTGHDVHISVDVEADGPIPVVHSMSSLGACVAGAFDGKRFTRLDPAAATFYAELQPVSEEFDPQAAAVSGWTGTGCAPTARTRARR
jgi:hypothetical protein